MPGFEIINSSEQKEISTIFKKGKGVLFRHGFENLRNKSFKVEKFEKNFSNKFGSKYCLAVTSGTAALRVALAAKKIGPGDEVITQSFTFVATVEAIIESGAKPICTEIDQTLNMCAKDLKKKISRRTKAVIVVHMLGTPARLDLIKKICDQNKITLIEDTAWGIGAKFKNKYLGTIGDMGTFSFDFAKTITTGEGGMICFRNKKDYKSARAWHDHGHENNPKVPRWEDTRSSGGFNFRMNELQGAVGIVQLKKFKKLYSKQSQNRKKIIEKIVGIKQIKIRDLPKNSTVAPESLIFSFNNKTLARKFRQKFSKKGYSTKILPEAITWHFAGKWKHLPELNLKKNNYFKKSNNILDKCVSIPIFYKMKNNFPDLVYEAIKETL